MQQASNSTPRNALQPDYELLWYKIRSVLGQGAFGITYLAQDMNLKRLVAIKEFLPSQYAMREGNETVRPVSEDLQERFSWGLRRFIDEARILDQFDHENIIRITNIFEANQTAYIVMRYEQGVNLKEILIRQKFLDQADLLNILFPILDGLEIVHEAGFIHRDIKPANIFIRTDGTPVLLDFGSARQSIEKQTHTLTSLVSPGYAPIEQYVSKSDKQGPWSDIYGMAATLYRAVTGFPPTDAVARGESITGSDEDNLISCRELADERYTNRFVAAIDHGLEFLTRDRPQSIKEWKEELSPLSETGELSKTILSGHASKQVMSLVKESLNQSVTRIYNNPDFSALKENDSDTTSVELAHKEGFRHGLKVAMAVLFLIISGLFIGNYQKMREVVSPGFVPEDIISDEPIEVLDQGQIVVGGMTEATRTPAAEKFEPVGQAENRGITLEKSPPLLDEETASRLEADGKIIIVDETAESDSHGLRDGDTAYNFPVEEFPEEGIFQQDIILDQETVIERSEIKAVDATSIVKEKPVIQSGLEVTEPKIVVIEEVPVPEKKRDPQNDYVMRFKNWVNFLVKHGEEGSGKSEDLKEQLGGHELENR